jgi:AraC family transcriptional regulator of adaptative response / DNA-3-methyladenine glycosylase II
VKHAIIVHVSHSLAPVLLNVIARIKRLFDLQANPMLVESQLGALAVASPGLRVPGAFDGLEVAVRAILGQQVSVKAASSLAGRVAKLLGQEIETPHDDLYLLSPTADALAGASLDDIASLGIIAARANSIIELAKAVSGGALSLEPGIEFDATIEKLKSVPGIGEWTAEYIAMRCLAWPDAFPHSDLGIKKALGRSTKKEIIEASEQWRPWRSYAAMHLWKSLEKVK